MSDVSVVKFGNGEITQVVVEGEVHFVGNDVATALGYSNYKKTMRKNTENDSRLKKTIFYKGQNRKVTLIDGHGVISLITKSNIISIEEKRCLLTQLGITHVATSRKEIEFVKLLESIIKPLGLTLVTQYHVEGFRIDAYIPEVNLAIEYDEEAHKYQKDADKLRESIIKKKLGCTFLRVSEHESDGTNVGKVMKVLFKKMQNEKK